MKCPTCNCHESKSYTDKKSGKEKINLCIYCKFGLAGHKKMAKPKENNNE